MKLLRFVVFGVFFLAVLQNAKASDLVSVSAVAREKADLTEVLLEFDVQEGCHIFAPYEQEFGEPLKVAFELPQGVEIVEQSFSKPQRFDQEDFSFDGYEDKAFYKTTLKGKTVQYPLKAVLKWQVCADDECLPQTEVIEMDITDSQTFEEKLSAASVYFMEQYSTFDWERLLFSLMAAFVGGLILNLMPCIFPVLSLKLLSLIKTDVATRHTEALFYGFGVVVSMLLLAVVLFVIRLFYPLVSWGFQLQSSVFVALMFVLFVFLSLMMLDIVQINNGFLSRLAGVRSQNKKIDAFLTGLLAVLIASPCSAPFMGAAVGYALMSPAYIYFPVFFFLGLGYALPFALLACYPKMLQKILPRPGKWMDVLKKVLSLPLLLTCVWLAWIFCAQMGWIVSGKNLQWQTYSKENVVRALDKKQPVFIDFTAKWCLTCLVNKQTSLQSDTLAELVKKHNILLLRADATNHEKNVAKALNFYGRASVPLYIYYDGKSEDYLILPQILTPDVLSEYLQ